MRSVVRAAYWGSALGASEIAVLRGSDSGSKTWLLPSAKNRRTPNVSRTASASHSDTPRAAFSTEIGMTPRIGFSVVSRERWPRRPDCGGITADCISPNCVMFR